MRKVTDVLAKVDTLMIKADTSGAVHAAFFVQLKKDVKNAELMKAMMVSATVIQETSPISKFGKKGENATLLTELQDALTKVKVVQTKLQKLVETKHRIAAETEGNREGGLRYGSLAERKASRTP